MFRVAVFACLATACAGTQTPPPAAPPVTRPSPPAPAAPEDAGRLLERAAEAHFQHQLEPEERLLEQVAAGEGPAHRRVTAHVRLANLAWRFRADPVSGRAHLARAEALAENAPASDELADARVDAAIERSRL